MSDCGDFATFGVSSGEGGEVSPDWPSAWFPAEWCYVEGAAAVGEGAARARGIGDDVE
jgi:hypothetical protein